VIKNFFFPPSRIGSKGGGRGGTKHRGVRLDKFSFLKTQKKKRSLASKGGNVSFLLVDCLTKKPCPQESEGNVVPGGEEKSHPLRRYQETRRNGGSDRGEFLCCHTNLLGGTLWWGKKRVRKSKIVERGKKDRQGGGQLGKNRPGEAIFFWPSGEGGEGGRKGFIQGQRPQQYFYEGEEKCQKKISAQDGFEGGLSTFRGGGKEGRWSERSGSRGGGHFEPG